MPEIIEVIYEDGVFKPLKKIELKEKTKAKVILRHSLDEFFGLFKKSKSLDLDEERDMMIEERL